MTTVGILRAALLFLVLLAGPATPVVAQQAAGWGQRTTLVPASIRIPGIQLDAPVVPLGLEPDGAMAAPSDPDTVGWYMFGPGFGSPGNMILDGHVDWCGRLRAFGLLNRLRPGAMIPVGDADGLTIEYVVQWSSLVDVNAAPVADIFAQGPSEEITLITCGGTFDYASRQYLSRLIVRGVRATI